MSESVLRFSLRERVEHFAAMTLFITLAVTGLPQRFPDAWLSEWLVSGLGGIGSVRLAHRVAGVAFALLGAWHVGALVVLLHRGRLRPSLVPHRSDFTDAIGTLRYYLGQRPQPPRFGHFDYRQKFEYWGLVLGGAVMVVTGFVLLFPIPVSTWLPGSLIPVAKVAHASEGLMALLVVVVWHIYNAHLAPEVFPFETSIFTGEISKERLRHEHSLEYEELFGASGDAPPEDS